MKHVRTKYGTACILSAALLAMVGCSKSENPGPGDGNGEEHGEKYFIAATAGSSTYLLTANDLGAGTATIVGNGVEIPRTYNMWVNNGTTASVGLIYAQGDPGIGISYGLDANGVLAPVGNEFQITSRFTTYGAFDKYVITGVSGQTLTDGKTGSVFNFIDLENHNSMTQKTVVTENFTGNGQQATFSGIVDLGNGEFLTGLVVSEPKDPSQGGGGSTGPVTHPDSVWVAALDADLNVKRIYRDDRISYASGRFKSQYYSQIAKAGDGMVYVFSGAYDGNTTKPAGALRIKGGATEFDADYYFNIEAESGGYRFRKVWHITEDYFLLEVYNDVEYGSSTPATQYAVVKMKEKTLKWVTQGFPAKNDITATGLPFADNGKIYFPVTTASAQPTVYVIDPATATAKAGLVVEAEGIASLSRFTY
ncbi:MAG TPA: DUF4374 domain-containing protein [Parapedobacter sp.]|uniref:DUF4374 domain-containing protein n=1 Tax=Parapedobacter sp. TaxID=1958893 RepID=UPI002C183263|nr:DUF4374 domain-containing protein [Parapedobacter sp.]HWK57843.1 DUF4374 domain-containing protein [Parapedobacter sp.]